MYMYLFILYTCVCPNLHVLALPTYSLQIRKQ